MDNTLVLALFVALTGLTLICAEDVENVELEIFPATKDIKQGDTVTIKCTATNKKHLDFVRILRRFDEEEVFTISTNNFVDQMFANDPRYVALPTVEFDHKATYTVNITDVQGKDGGRIVCRLQTIRSRKGIEAFEDLEVKVPPSLVQLQYRNKEGEMVPVGEGENLQLHHGVEGAIACHVNITGSDKEPRVEILMDNRDITNKFLRNKVSDRGVLNGYMKADHTDDFVYTTDNPKKDDNGKSIQCKASTFNFPPVTASAKLDIYYPPELHCQQRMFAKKGSKNIKIFCRGKMFPAPQISTWSFGKRPNRTVIENGETTDVFTAQHEHLGGDEYEFALTISEVGLDHFHKYKIEASNGIGATADASIKLHEEGTVIVDENGAASSSPMTFLGSLLSLLFAAFIIRP